MIINFPRKFMKKVKKLLKILFIIKLTGEKRKCTNGVDRENEVKD